MSLPVVTDPNLLFIRDAEVNARNDSLIESLPLVRDVEVPGDRDREHSTRKISEWSSQTADQGSTVITRCYEPRPYRSRNSCTTFLKRSSSFARTGSAIVAGTPP